MVQCLESPIRRTILSHLLDGKRHKFSTLVEDCEESFDNDRDNRHIYADIGQHVRYMSRIGLVEKHNKALNGAKGAYYQLDTDKIKQITIFINATKFI